MTVRWRTDRDKRRRTPVHVVWEITLSCNLKCSHCGSRAGAPRSDELDTRQALGLVDALAASGTREITIIGGEAYLRRDWLQIVAAIAGHGMYCAMQTGGRALTLAKLTAAAKAGLGGLGVSIDGTAAIHDAIRGVRGSYDQALAAIRHAKALGLNLSVNTQINALSKDCLDEVFAALLAEGIEQWQLQLTVAMGNAVDNDALLLQPFELVELMPTIARLCTLGRERGMFTLVGNNIGYFGPYEQVFRGFAQAERHWNGCEAGSTVMGIEADGAIKGCPSLETRKYGLGNVRDRALQDIWDDAKAVRPDKQAPGASAKNFCGACYYRETCAGGCTWTADSLTGNGLDNPFCHYRASRLDAHGLRERIAKIQDASPLSFGVGRFAILCENRDGAPADEEAWRALVASEGAKRKRGAQGDMIVCDACEQFLYAAETACPHCAAPVAAEARDEQMSTLQARRAMGLLNERLAEIGAAVD